MTDFMTQQSFGLTAPVSRQDIVSALLNEYGNSFGHGDGSSSTLSPVPAEKELPPPPPQSGSLMNKPLPAVARAEKRMSMKFQLRVIEDAPLSPNSARTASPAQRSRRKIPFRSLSREAKPPSLNLITSNGSTAIVPPTPALSARAQTFPISNQYGGKELPSPPPPPPPAKSERRSNTQSAMGLQQSKSQSELARNDSLLSQGELEQRQPERPATVEAAPSVKRKALPVPAVKKFRSLAELGTGPRGGKGGPLPPTSAPRKKSVDSQASSSSEVLSARVKEEEVGSQANEHLHIAPAVNQLPPTPEEDKAVAPVPPRKTFAALGLPSNPRAKGGAISPKHVRGKSSTGFNLMMKAQRPAPPIPSAMKLDTITPEMTPSPTMQKSEMPAENDLSPLSALPPTTTTIDERRPFSYEAPQVQAQVKPAEMKQPVIAIDARAPSPLSENDATITRTTTPVSPLEPQPHLPISPPSPLHDQQQQPTLPIAPPAPFTRTTTPPPFAPLTRLPIPLPASSIPPITSSHLTCYTSHSTSTWSNNTFQPLGCMVCGFNERDRKWKCTWCQLRICRGCSEELGRVQGRSLAGLLGERERRRVEKEEMRESREWEVEEMEGVVEGRGLKGGREREEDLRGEELRDVQAEYERLGGRAREDFT